MVFLLSGTPGTGKTQTILQLQAMGLKAIDLGQLLAREAVSRDDKRRGAKVIDERKALLLAKEASSKFQVLAWTDLSFLDSTPEAVIILRTNPLTLKRRLESRGYAEDKVKENVAAEFLGTVQFNFLRKWPDRSFELDTTMSTPSEIAAQIVSCFEGKLKSSPIDWTVAMEESELLQLLDYLATWMPERPKDLHLRRRGQSA